ncbi:MAG: murein biosynthesis integral membrane protein MurJ [Planctomycetaceae bacterium]
MGALTLFSRLMGMIRDMAMAAVFGAGPVMDTFSLAFRLPNLARRLFGEGAQTAAFLPEFVRTQEQLGPDAARQLASGTFAALGWLLTLLVLVVEVVLLTILVTVELSADSRFLLELLVLLSPYLIVICLAAQQSAVLHGLNHFDWPAAVPVVLNIVWLLALPPVVWLVADDRQRMMWLSGAILFAGLLQMLLPAWRLWIEGFRYSVRIGPAIAGVRSVFAAMGPILIGVTITQFNTVFDSLLAWWLSPGMSGSHEVVSRWLPAVENGTASALYFGQRLYQFPLGIIGVGIGTVLFPRLTRHAERGELRLLRRELESGLAVTLAIGLPASVGLMVLASPIQSLLLEHGAFAADDGRLTSRMIEGYGPAVLAFMGLLLVQRAYYAVGDRVTPMRHSLAALVVNVVLDLSLLHWMGGPGLAWATSTAATFQCAVALWQLQRRVGRLDWSRLGIVLGRTILATAVMAIVCRLVAPPLGDAFAERLLAAGVPLVAGVVTFFLTARLIGLRAPWLLLRHGEVE